MFDLNRNHQGAAPWWFFVYVSAVLDLCTTHGDEATVGRINEVNQAGACMNQ